MIGNLNFLLKFPTLDIKSLQLLVYSDASYAINYDKTSQLEYFIIMVDKIQSSNPMNWNSYESKNANIFILGNEVMAFADALIWHLH